MAVKEGTVYVPVKGYEDGDPFPLLHENDLAEEE